MVVGSLIDKLFPAKHKLERQRFKWVSLFVSAAQDVDLAFDWLYFNQVANNPSLNGTAFYYCTLAFAIIGSLTYLMAITRGRFPSSFFHTKRAIPLGFFMLCTVLFEDLPQIILTSVEPGNEAGEFFSSVTAALNISTSINSTLVKLASSLDEWQTEILYKIRISADDWQQLSLRKQLEHLQDIAKKKRGESNRSGRKGSERQVSIRLNNKEYLWTELKCAFDNAKNLLFEDTPSAFKQLRRGLCTFCDKARRGFPHAEATSSVADEENSGKLSSMRGLFQETNCLHNWERPFHLNLHLNQCAAECELDQELEYVCKAVVYLSAHTDAAIPRLLTIR